MDDAPRDVTVLLREWSGGDAAAHLERSLAVFAELERADPRNLTYKDDIGRNFTQLGLARYQQRRYADALAAFGRAVEVFEYQSADPKNFFPRKHLAAVSDHIADTHRDLAASSGGEGRRAHLRAARQHYARALHLLTELQAQNALAERDRKFLEEVRAAAEKYKDN